MKLLYLSVTLFNLIGLAYSITDATCANGCLFADITIKLCKLENYYKNNINMSANCHRGFGKDCTINYPDCICTTNQPCTDKYCIVGRLSACTICDKPGLGAYVLPYYKYWDSICYIYRREGRPQALSAWSSWNSGQVGNYYTSTVFPRILAELSTDELTATRSFNLLGALSSIASRSSSLASVQSVSDAQEDIAFTVISDTDLNTPTTTSGSSATTDSSVASPGSTLTGTDSSAPLTTVVTSMPSGSPSSSITAPPSSGSTSPSQAVNTATKTSGAGRRMTNSVTEGLFMRSVLLLCGMFVAMGML